MTELKRRVKQAWRATRKHLPEGVAEGIRVPTKRALRALGVIKRPASG
jgi:hypothetical protein